MSETAAFEIVEHEARVTAVVRGTVAMTDLAGFFDRSFGLLAPTLADQGVVPQSAAFALYRSVPTDVVDLEVGFVTDRAVQPTDDVVVSELPGGTVARTVHAGSFDGLGDAWGALMGQVVAQGRTPGTMWEVYLTEPSPDMDPADLRTELVVVVS